MICFTMIENQYLILQGHYESQISEEGELKMYSNLQPGNSNLGTAVLQQGNGRKFTQVYFLFFPSEFFWYFAILGVNSSHLYIYHDCLNQHVFPQGSDESELSSSSA